VATKDQLFQINTLIYTMGPKVEDVLSELNLSDDDQQVYTTVAACFEEHFIVQHNIIFERAQFNKQDQGEEEAADAYITTLYSMARHLRFGELHDALLRDQTVVGIKDKNLSEKLQMDLDLTLKKAVDLVCHREFVKRQQITLNNATTALDIDAAVVTEFRRDEKTRKNVNDMVDFIQDRKVSRSPGQMFPLIWYRAFCSLLFYWPCFREFLSKGSQLC